MHRVVAKIVNERLGNQHWLDTDFEEMVQDFISQNPTIEWFINDSVGSSFEEAVKE